MAELFGRSRDYVSSSKISRAVHDGQTEPVSRGRTWRDGSPADSNLSVHRDGVKVQTPPGAPLAQMDRAQHS